MEQQVVSHQERFTGRADVYQKYRTRYPDTALRSLEQRCGLTSSWQVADIGAGTGMLTELFLEHGNPVIAVEPNAEMRSACEQLSSRFPQLRCVDAMAEATGLPEHSVDIVAAGRAFHWFDPVRARAEFQRILRPQGWVALVSSGRQKGDAPSMRDYEHLLEEHGVDFAQTLHRYNAHQRMDEFFAGGEWWQMEFLGEQQLTLEELAGQTQSLSFAPDPEHPKYAGMQQALREYFDRYQQDGRLHMPTICHLTCGRFAANTR